MEDVDLSDEIDDLLSALDSSAEVVPLIVAILSERRTLRIDSVLRKVVQSGGLFCLTKCGQENLLSLLLSRKDYQICHEIDSLVVPYLRIKKELIYAISLCDNGYESTEDMGTRNEQQPTNAG